MRKMSFIVCSLFILIGTLCQGQNATYKHYAIQSDLEVAYLEGFQLDSHNKMDVLLLIAKEKSSWQRLTQEFNLSNNKQDDSCLVHMLRSRFDPTQPQLPKLLENCSVVSWSDKRTIIIYYFESESQVKTIIQSVSSLLKSN